MKKYKKYTTIALMCATTIFAGIITAVILISNTGAHAALTSEYSIKPVYVSAGGHHSLAIDVNDNLYSWGGNGYGALGDGTITTRPIPAKIGNDKWESISAGSTHSLGITKGGYMYAWGGYYSEDWNAMTKLTLFGNSPTQFDSPYDTMKWSMVSAGYTHSLAISEDGDLYCWGDNDYGQLGNGEITDAVQSTPLKIGNKKWVMASAGYYFSLAIDNEGYLFAWGTNGGGQLGDGTNAPRTSPVQIGTNKWSEISAGNSFSTGIDTNGYLFAWGNNYGGQLGDGTSTNRNTPQQVGTIKYSAVSSKGSSVLALDREGYLYGWGNNNQGQLGDGTTSNCLKPVQIGTDKWAAISSHGGHSLIVNKNGYLFATGYNFGGQQGNGESGSGAPSQLVFHALIAPYDEHIWKTSLQSGISCLCPCIGCN